MNLFSISSLLIFIFSIFLAGFTFLKNRQKIGKLWVLFCLLASIWGIGGYKFSTATTYDEAFFWWQIAYICVILSPVIYVHFIFAFFALRKKFFLRIFYILAFFFLALDLFVPRLFLPRLRFVFDQFWFLDWFSTYNSLYLLFYLTFYWFLLGYGFFLLIANFKKTSGVRRQQIRYFILASMFGWGGVEPIFFPIFRIDIYPYTNFFTAFYPLIITYAIIKYHLMDIRVAITRTGIFLTLYTLVLGVPFYIGYKTHSWVLSTSLAVILATIGPVVYRILQKKAEDILLAQQRHYQKLLLQAAGGMVREHNLKRLFRLIVHIVKKAVGIEFACIYGHNSEKKTYELMAVRDSRYSVSQHIVSENAEVIKYIKEKSSPFIPEEAPPDMRKDLENIIGSSFGLIVPSVIEKDLLGFLVLGDKFNKSTYTQDDINVFNILSHQASLAIENCLFFEEFKKAQNRIFEAEKLASIGGMADGLAHQIKNRLNYFSVASGELKMEIEDLAKKCPQIINDSHLKESYDYILQIADSLLENVRRTDQVIKGILNYSRTQEKDTYFGFFSLKEIIDLSLGLLKIKHKEASFSLKEEIFCDNIYGIKSQMSEVIYNLLDNAYEACYQKKSLLSLEERKKYSFQIAISSSQKESSYIITVSDNGIGIEEEDKLKIFAPFFTTKSSFKPVEGVKSGTGIGMYIVKRLIEENHRGEIWFESEYMKGTTFYIKLPFKSS